MIGLPEPLPAVQVNYWLAKIHSGYEFHESSALNVYNIDICKILYGR